METVRKTQTGRTIGIDSKIHVRVLEYVRLEMDEFFNLRDFLSANKYRASSQNKNILKRLIRNYWLTYNKKTKEISLSRKSIKYLENFQSFLNPNGPLMRKCRERVNKKTTEIMHISREDIFLGEY